MRELIERFTYRFHLWQKERQWMGEPAGGGNPLRIFAFVTVVSFISDAYYVFRQHRIDAMIVFRTVSGVAFLVLYFRPSVWAWHLTVAGGPCFLLLYWFLYAVDGLSRPPHPTPVSVQVLGVILQLVILGGVTFWLFVIRERYFRYVADARSSKA